MEKQALAERRRLVHQMIAWGIPVVPPGHTCADGAIVEEIVRYKAHYIGCESGIFYDPEAMKPVLADVLLQSLVAYSFVKWRLSDYHLPGQRRREIEIKFVAIQAQIFRSPIKFKTSPDQARSN